MYICEVCGKQADKHHIVHRHEGGLDIPLNIKYLCNEHHRGKLSPHKNSMIDNMYKLEMQERLESLLVKDYYTTCEASQLLDIKERVLKRILKGFKLYKEGYRNCDITYCLMGNKCYTEDILVDYGDIEPIIELAY